MVKAKLADQPEAKKYPVQSKIHNSKDAASPKELRANRHNVLVGVSDGKDN